jgi:hypothetical protein
MEIFKDDSTQHPALTAILEDTYLQNIDIE